MKSPSRKYTDLVRDASNKYGNWDPPKRLKLGDFGTLNKEDGQFEKEGNIFTHEQTVEIAKTNEVIVASPEEKMLVTAKATSSGELSLEPGVSIAGLADASIKCEVKFGSKRGALLVLAKPKTSYIPKAQLLKFASAPVLKDKCVVTEIVECPAYSLYLSTAREETIRVAFTGSVPIPHVPGLSATASVEPAAWWSQHSAGFYRQACSKEGEYNYTPLYQLQQVRKPSVLLYRDSPIPEDEKWVPTPPPWDQLDSDGEEMEFEDTVHDFEP